MKGSSLGARHSDAGPMGVVCNGRGPSDRGAASSGQATPHGAAAPGREAAARPTGRLAQRTPPSSAVRQIFDAHYDHVWRLLRRLGVRQSQLDDATQEVFWTAARKLVDIRAGSERAFLYGVALRVASHENRRRCDGPTLADDGALALLSGTDPSPEEVVQRRQARALLDAVLDRMATELRTIFVLCELEELEVREAAALEGVPIGTASSRLRRAREEFSAIARRVRLARAAGGG